MLDCLKPSSSSIRSNHHSQPQGSSRDDTLSSSSQPSPRGNLTYAYSIAVQTNSYSELWSMIHPQNSSQESNIENGKDQTAEQLLVDVLKPSHDCIEAFLCQIKQTTLTRLVSDYFRHSEDTSLRCIHLQTNVRSARTLYHHLHVLLDVLPPDFDTNPLSQPQCNRAFDILLEFNGFDNPFPCPSSHFFGDMRTCFSLLKQQLEQRRNRSCSQGPLIPVLFACQKNRKELAQVEAAARGIFVLNNHLDTIDRLVRHLHNAVEDDKPLIQLGTDWGKDIYAIQRVLKQLSLNHHTFFRQLKELEEHICLCFLYINSVRSLLLEKLQSSAGSIIHESAGSIIHESAS
ncbi:UPF0496 protein At3g19330 [Impatiens glandulifera]|uniref:UPF0496 protein At3g19330 n=1 Tax=Impatiens glandulifera TaxID=253017 RepID=UPI001FB12906|nr:UPF0496 protein At3g19330 [Impatiens glandulifera]XP_047315436.1 UPF0496 protein At3g19330 [Impatiens glandulifera]XP_047315437.1 UPF0496 protein At3g19330 [Impatiens glandulifera]XP_047315438.1 UPF0496 protein At3g19330 [Impatiens glandulifera]XP_047315439.1 UPF0496 protein At3g19330 [Impatiens glandulifera]XP_047315440.1 UPF0496 protein At3g19330 [Impatiens glandulifera]XP_047315441.1 UPF0496 protein At3g19330 [Impatiens glandulifera]